MGFGQALSEMIPGCKFSQELELIGDPFKRSRGIFKINASICSLEEKYGSSSEKSLLPGCQGSIHKAQADFSRTEAVI